LRSPDIGFRQDERDIADDIVNRFRMPEACRDFLVSLEPFQCFVRCRDRYAVLGSVLSPRLREICDTNSAMRDELR